VQLALTQRDKNPNIKKSKSSQAIATGSKLKWKSPFVNAADRNEVVRYQPILTRLMDVLES
jgi:hypothetical protein